MPWEEKNATFFIDPVIMNASYPIEDKQCLRRVNLTGYVPEGGGNAGSSGDSTRLLSDGLMTCEEFVFDTSIYKSTTTSEVWYIISTNIVVVSSTGNYLVSSAYCLYDQRIHYKK